RRRGMKTRFGWAVAIAVGLAVASCGGGSSGGSAEGAAGTGGGSTTMGGAHGCTNVQASCSSNNGLSCEEWAGYDAASVANFMKNCDRPGQVYSTGPCDKTNAVGGCMETPNDVCAVIWSFP